MRLVHFADTHLDFRTYDRLDANGVNVREADVASTFRTLVDDVIALRPDAVVIAGDIFHSARPTNRTILFAQIEFARLVRGLGGAPVVMVAGNHDCYTGSALGQTLLPIFRELGVHVVPRDAERLRFGELSILCVPDAPGVVRPPLEPDPTARYNVLLLHGEVHGMPGLHGDRSRVEIPVEDVHVTRWDYIALGHYHVHHMLAPNMGYSGSIDYTSTNPWGERDDERAKGLSGKGFIERDLVTGAQTFHPLPRSRDFLDLTLSANGMTDAELSTALVELLEDEHIDGTIARVVVTDCPKEVSAAIDHKMVRSFKARALNLNLTYRRPEVIRIGSSMAGAIFRRRPLEELLAEVIRRNRADQTSDVSLERITALGLQYLEEAKEGGPDLVPALEASLEPTAPAAVAAGGR